MRDQKKNPYLEDLRPEHTGTVFIEENTQPIKSMGFTIDELLKTIGQLPDHHRRFFNLYVLEKFTHAEIGEEQGISEGTLKSHLARARKKVKQLLAERAQHRDEEDDKRAFPLPVAIDDDTKMDQMFGESFEHFLIPPRHPLSIELILQLLKKNRHH